MITARRFDQIVQWIRAAMQRCCRHQELHWIADAWDWQYTCDRCGRVWFNEMPKVVAAVTWRGGVFNIDGSGSLPPFTTFTDSQGRRGRV